MTKRQKTKLLNTNFVDIADRISVAQWPLRAAALERKILSPLCKFVPW